MKEKIVIINFSGRLNGNCGEIAKYIKEIKENTKIYNFAELKFSNCSKCSYECLKENICLMNDDLKDFYSDILNCEEIIFIVPNYCGFPCSNYFIYAERLCGGCINNKVNYFDYLKIPKKFIIVTNTNLEYMKSSLAYQIPSNIEIDYLQIASGKYSKNSIGLWASKEEVKQDILNYFLNK